MNDTERIVKIVADLDRYYRDLDSMSVKSPIMTKERFYSLSMILFSILNRLIDLGQEIIRGKNLGVPSSYKEVFQVLAKEKILSPTLSTELQYLAARRNVLAHEYFDVTERDIYGIYLKIAVGKKFIVEVKKLLLRK